MVLALAGLLACGGTAATAPELTPGAVGSLAAALQAEPDRADAILDEAGTDWDQLEDALFDIAGDENATRAYLAAREGR